MKLQGKRRRALALRALDHGAGPRDLARLGLPVDPDLLFRSLAYAIDPEWARGYRFKVAYQLIGDRGGGWHVEVDDGQVRSGRGLGDQPDAIVRMRMEDANARRRDHALGLDPAGPDGDRGADPAGDLARALDRPRGRPGWPGA